MDGLSVEMGYADCFVPKQDVWEMNKNDVYQVINDKILDNKRSGSMKIKIKLDHLTPRDEAMIGIAFIKTFIAYQEEFIEELRENQYDANIMELPVEEDDEHLYRKQKANFLVIDWEY